MGFRPLRCETGSLGAPIFFVAVQSTPMKLGAGSPQCRSPAAAQIWTIIEFKILTEASSRRHRGSVRGRSQTQSSGRSLYYSDQRRSFRLEWLQELQHGKFLMADGSGGAIWALFKWGLSGPLYATAAAVVNLTVRPPLRPTRTQSWCSSVGGGGGRNYSFKANLQVHSF